MNNTQPNTMKVLSAFATIYFVWGTTYLAILYGVETIPPFLLMGVRCLVAGSVLYTWGRLRGDAGITRRQFGPILLIGVLFFLIGHGILAWAEKSVPTGIAALLIASEPLWVALLESRYTNDAVFNRRVAMGILLGLAGIVLLVLPQGFDFRNANVLGTFGILLGTVSWGGGSVYARNAGLPRSPLITAGAQLLAGAAFLCTASYLLGEWNDFSVSQVSLRSVFGLAYLIIFGSVITFSAYTWLLTVTSVTRISTHTFVNPVVAMLVGWAFADEALTAEMLLATLLIIAAVYLVLFRKKPAARDAVLLSRLKSR